MSRTDAPFSHKIVIFYCLYGYDKINITLWTIWGQIGLSRVNLEYWMLNFFYLINQVKPKKINKFLVILYPCQNDDAYVTSI